MGYGYNYGYGMYGLTSVAAFSAVGLLAGIICAIVLSIVFLKKENSGKFTGFVGWLYEFLNFQKLTIEMVVKICYIFLAVWLTITAFGFIAVSFASFLMILIFGNLGLRLSHELIMLNIKICRNTIEINKKMNVVVAATQKTEPEVYEEVVSETVVEETVVEEESEVQDEVIVEEVIVEETLTENSEELVCPNCGHVSPSEMVYCSKCGTKLK